MRRRRIVRMLNAWRRKIQPIALTILVLTSMRSAVADWNDVPTGSMKPSIIEGDRVLVNRLAYGLKVPFTTWHVARWNEPSRGEIVVFNSPVDGVRLIKRVIGVPGDVLVMIDNRLFINARPVEYSARDDGQITERLGTAEHSIMTTSNRASMRSFGPIQVPAGEYFMMGDNRDNSNDSRYIGTIRLDQVLGRSSTVALSLDYDHHYMPRWDRFFKALD